MVFLRDQTLFDSQLKRTIFSDLIKSKQFFHHLLNLFLRMPFYVLEVSPHLPRLSTGIFDKESHCMEYVEQNC